jgi:hypothetical protein
LRRIIGAHAAHQIQEFAVEIAAHPLRKPRGIAIQGFREPLILTGRGMQFLRVYPNSVNRRTHRERLSVAIENRAAVSRQFCHTRIACFALIFVEVLTHELQLNCSRQ